MPDHPVTARSSLGAGEGHDPADRFFIHELSVSYKIGMTKLQKPQHRLSRMEARGAVVRPFLIEVAMRDIVRIRLF